MALGDDAADSGNDTADALSPEILTAVTSGLLRAVERRGLERAALLQQAGLQQATLECPDTWIPIAWHLRVGHAIAAAFRGSNVGLQTGAPIYSDPQGALGFSLRRSRVHRNALANFAAYIRTVNRAVRLRLSAQLDETVVVVEMVPEMAAAGHPAESLLAAWLSISRHLTGENWCPTQVDFQHRPIGDAAEHRALFGCEVAFGQAQTRMILPERVCAFVVPELPHPFSEAIRGAGELASTFSSRSAGSLIELLERLLTNPLRVDALRSPSDASTSEARLALGRALLATSSASVHEAAYLLGFESSSCFQRAYSNRYGSAPARVPLQTR
ncbi:MAG TPA: AraC family transcriptional regulator ligand-binding domain-containing protein [Polyangiaceae bacterium]|nr:AraC family transcriptional regulator ligand-binding domain-containing protein [Polyangiaceae bacterium]